MKRKNMRMGRKALSFLCIFALLITMIPVTALAAQASDISNHWAKTQIGNMMDKGYITGYQDGTFKPDQKITRAEFMAIINRAFNFTQKSEGSFTDVKPGAWYADVVSQAKAAGYISGYPDGSIRPDDTITRQEAAVIIAKIKRLAADASGVADFKDAYGIAGWSKGNIGAVAASGLMNGYPDGSFRATNNITRAEAAVVLDKALQFEAYSTAGAYGPESGAKTINGNVGVYADGVTLQNMVIEGNLLLAASIGEGTVTLKNVTVKGTTNVKGGGEHSIIVIDSTLDNVNIVKENGKIRIVISGNTTIDELVINVPGVAIKIEGGSTVKTLVLNKAAAVTGTGTVQLAKINAEGSTFEKQPVTVEDNTGGNQQPVTPSTGSSGSGGGHHNSGSSTYADMVLKNGIVYSVNGTSKDTEATISEAVAVKDGKIIYVGTDSGVKPYVKEGTTQEIDLNGKMVLPGFSDSHAHAKAMAANMFDISLYATPAPGQVVTAIEQWIMSHPGITYITGNGWDTLQEAGMIAAHDALNAATVNDIPVVLYDSSHHIAWANDKAIAVAGISKNTPDPPGGQIIHYTSKDAPKPEKAGELTGIFHEDSAISLVMKAIPDNTKDQYMEGIQAYQAMANSYGLTLNQDPQVSAACIDAYEELANAGDLTMRFRGGYTATPVVNTTGDAFAVTDAAVEAELAQFAEDSAVKHTSGGDLFQMNFVKIYGDGGGPTTYMKENKDSSNAVWPADQLNYLCDQLEKNGVQIHCHSMGDAALDEFLDAFEYAKSKGDTAQRNSITHLQYVDDGTNGTFPNGTSSNDGKKMAELGVIGIPQPFWMVKDPYFTMYWPSCGKARTEACYPMQSLIDEGVIMAGGSDWPVTQPNAPLTSIQIGMTRTLPYDDPAVAYTPDMQRNPMYRTSLGAGSEKASLRTMIQSVTINGAYAMFLENVTGSIEVGKSADMVVLDKDLRHVDPKDIGKTNVMMTIFKGNIVYAASQPTVTDYGVVKYKSAPSYPGDPTTYSLVVSAGTTADDLIGALNAPVGGSLDLVYSVGSDTELIGLTVPDEETVTDSMELVSLAPNPEKPSQSIETDYSIVVDLPDMNNTIVPGSGKTYVYTVEQDTFVITLENPIPIIKGEHGAPDVYPDFYLMGSDNISAVTLDVTDVSDEFGHDADSGYVYKITAMDPAEQYVEIAPDVWLAVKPLHGTYSVYAYPPYVPPYIPYPDYVFTNNGAETLTFPD